MWLQHLTSSLGQCFGTWATDELLRRKMPRGEEMDEDEANEIAGKRALHYLASKRALHYLASRWTTARIRFCRPALPAANTQTEAAAA